MSGRYRNRESVPVYRVECSEDPAGDWIIWMTLSYRSMAERAARRELESARGVLVPYWRVVELAPGRSVVPVVWCGSVEGMQS